MNNVLIRFCILLSSVFITCAFGEEPGSIRGKSLSNLISEIEGCLLWLNASDTGSVHQIDGRVSKWEDKSGNENHVIQTNETHRPLYVEGMGPRPSVFFDGADDFLSSLRPMGMDQDPDFTVFVVLQSNSKRNWMYAGPLTASADHSLFFSSYPSIRCEPSQISYGSNRFSGDQPHVLMYQRTRVNNEVVDYGLDIDGFPAYPTWSRNPGHNLSLQPKHVWIGARGIREGNGIRIDHRDRYAPYKGYIAEVMVFNRTLTPIEIDQIEAYIAIEWPDLVSQPENTDAKEFLLPVATNTNPRVAVMTSSNKDDVLGMADLLQAELVDAGEYELVERQQVDQVLEEQNIQGAFLPENLNGRIQLGRILKANLLLFVNSVSEIDGPSESSFQITLADSDTGIRFASKNLEVEDFTHSHRIKETAFWIQENLERIQEGYTKIVAVPPFQTRDAEFNSLSLRGALSELVQTILHQKPGILTVELTEALSIAKEYAVSSDSEELSRPLPHFIKGVFSLKDSALNLEVSIEIAGKVIKEAKLENISIQDLRSTLDRELSRLLDVTVQPEFSERASKFEARRFNRIGQIFSNAGFEEDAIRMFETSALLDNEYGDPYIGLAKIYDRRAKYIAGEIRSKRRKPDDYLEAVTQLLNTLERGYYRADHMGETSSVIDMFYRVTPLKHYGGEDTEQINQLYERGMYLMSGYLREFSGREGTLFGNYAGVLSETVRNYQENGYSRRAEMFNAMLKSLSGSTKHFRRQVSILVGHMDSPIMMLIREKIKNGEDAVLHQAMVYADWLHEIQGDDYILEVVRKKIESLKNVDNGRRDNILGVLNSWYGSKSPNYIKVDSLKTTQWVWGQEIPPVQLTPFHFAAGHGKIHDWLSMPSGDEWIASERGLFQYRPQSRQNLWKKISSKSYKQLVLDQEYIWALTDKSIEIWSNDKQLIEEFADVDIGVDLKEGAHQLTALGNGRIALCSEVIKENSKRSWVVLLSLGRGLSQGAKIEPKTLYVSQEDESTPYVDMSFSHALGSIPAEELALSAYRLHVETGDLQPDKFLRTGAYYPKLSKAEFEGLPIDGMVPVYGGNQLFLVQTLREPGWGRVDHKKQVLRVLRWIHPNNEPEVLFQDSFRSHCSASPNENGRVSGAFLDKQQLHIILGVNCNHRQPRWIALDLNTREVRVVSYGIPRILQESYVHEREVKIHHSNHLGVLATLEDGNSYQLLIPPRETWGFYGSEEDFEKSIYQDASSVGYQFSRLASEDIPQLIATGWDVNEVDEYGRTALFHAAFSSDVDLLNVLVNQQADLNIIDHKGITALGYAVKRGSNDDFIEALLKAGANPDLGGQNTDPPLHLAIWTQDPMRVQLLLENGADPNIKGFYEMPALYAACIVRRIYSMEICKLLVEAGADINERHPPTGLTALHLAASWKGSYLVRYLLENGANPNLKGTFFGPHLTPSERAMLGGNTRQYYRNASPKTPLEILIKQNSKDAVHTRLGVLLKNAQKDWND